VPGPHGLLEPSEPRRGVAAIARADAVIVPALAVDPGSGARLGRGAGCYDRALARVAAPIPVIALLYDDELVPFAAEPHDRPVTHVARPAAGITPVA
jgi:5-formyltetrahydrofolate cyclo-ligase